MPKCKKALDYKDFAITQNRRMNNHVSDPACSNKGADQSKKDVTMADNGEGKSAEGTIKLPEQR